MKKVTYSRLSGAILLIAGTSIGAAMLALPVTTGQSGFFLSMGTMFLMWVFLSYSAFMILEVNLSLPKDGNIISMAEHTLGKPGKYVAWVSYLFLLYALNTAYIAASTSFFADGIQAIFQILPQKVVCIIPVLVIFAYLLAKGLKRIDQWNKILMFGLMISYFLLLASTFTKIDAKNLFDFIPKAILPSLSIVVTAFGYHIVIPSIIPYLHNDEKSIKRAILIGSFIPFIAYALWQLAILGIVPQQGPISIEHAYTMGLNGSEILALATQSPYIAVLSQGFAFFAIMTSFLGVSISLYDFLKDGLQIKNESESKLKLYIFAFAPPCFFALYFPHVFFSALDYAGAFGVVTLLALIPAFMVFAKRYRMQKTSGYKAPIGKIGLIFYMLVCGFLIVLEIFEKTKILNF